MGNFTLLRAISNACHSQGLTASRFGRKALGDPSLVFELRAGRQLRARTRSRIEAFLASLKVEG